MVLYGMGIQFLPKIETLPPPQRKLWPELLDIPSEFVLYCGTAIALQLGHRESIDFDFFARAKFDPDELLGSIPFLSDATVLQKSVNTLTATVDRDGAVQVSFFCVPKLGRILAPLVVPETDLQVATLLDLAGTKAAVVQKRAEAKDYIDIDAILQHGDIDLPQSLSAACLIYGRQFNPELTMKALSFYGDGNLASVPAETQQRLTNAVKDVDLDKLPSLSQPQQKPGRESGQ